MQYPFVSIGYGSVVSVDRIVAVLGLESQPVDVSVGAIHESPLLKLD